jgi:hypothetical protein
MEQIKGGGRRYRDVVPMRPPVAFLVRSSSSSSALAEVRDMEMVATICAD